MAYANPNHWKDLYANTVKRAEMMRKRRATLARKRQETAAANLTRFRARLGQIAAAPGAIEDLIALLKTEIRRARSWMPQKKA
jgi:hypothetical protein